MDIDNLLLVDAIHGREEIGWKFRLHPLIGRIGCIRNGRWRWNHGAVEKLSRSELELTYIILRGEE
jgi:hypothetical protein